MKTLLLLLLGGLLCGLGAGLHAQTLPDSTWVCLGPKGGAITDLVMDTKNPAHLYALIDSGRIYHSTDCGEIWAPFHNTTGYSWIMSIIVHPLHSDLLYVQAAKFDETNGNWTSKLFRSTNQGTSWSDIPNLPGGFSPVSVETVYAVSTMNDTLKMSTDGGTSYTTVRKLPFSEYALSGVVTGNDGSIMVLRSGPGTVWRSTDRGLTWSKAMFGADSLVLDELAGRTGTGGYLYGRRYNQTLQTTTLSLSRDLGVTWSELPMNGLDSVTIQAIIPAPSDTATVWLWVSSWASPNNAMYMKTTNQGATWTRLPFIKTNEFRGLFHTADCQTFLVHDAGKIIKTTDGGNTWNEKNDGIVAHTINHVETPADGATLMFTDQRRIYHSHDFGQSWSDSLPVNLGWSMEVYASPTDGKKYFLIPGKFDTIFATTDGATSWSKVGTGFSNEYTGGYYDLSGFTVASADAKTLYYGSSTQSKTFKSTNGGTAWARVDSYQVSGITVAKSNASVLYGVISVHSGYYPSTNVVRKSMDGGSTWATMSSGLPAPPQNSTAPTFTATGIAVKPDDPNVVLLAGYSHTQSADTLRLYRTTNGGSSWSRITNGLPDKFPRQYSELSVVRVAANPNVPNEMALVGGPFGVYLSTDAGVTWTQLPSTGLSRPPLSIVIVRYGNKDVALVGSQSGSIFAYKLRDVAVGIRSDGPRIPQTFKLEQNFPNPFNPATEFRYRIADFGFVTLKIFDMLGREVATVVNGWYAAGEYRIRFDASSLASGVYWYRLDAAGASAPAKRFSQTRNMVIMR